MTRLVLVHGRDLDGHDPDTVETHWLAALNTGLAAAGSSLRLADDDADFVYYGDTLAHLLEGRGGAAPPVLAEVRDEGIDVAVRDSGAGDLGAYAVGGAPSSDAVAHDLADWPTGARQFALDVARDVLAGSGVEPPEPTAQAEGLLDPVFEALARAVALLDRIPGVSAAVVLLIARDVWAYLHDEEVHTALDEGVAEALPEAPSVVVAHSLGALVTWSVLAGRHADRGRVMPLLVTMGCPLPIRAVRVALQARGPLVFPPGVARWVNVRDPLDLVGLRDITPESFPLPAGSPAVENLVVDNRAPGNHAAAALLDDGTYAGYLATAPVAQAIATALGRTV